MSRQFRGQVEERRRSFDSPKHKEFYIKPRSHSEFCKEDVYVYNPKNIKKAIILTEPKPDSFPQLDKATPRPPLRHKSNIDKDARSELEKKFYSLLPRQMAKFENGEKYVTINKRPTQSTETSTSQLTQSLATLGDKTGRPEELKPVESEAWEMEDYQNLSEVFVKENEITLEHVNRSMTSWFKPLMSRQDSINLLQNKPGGAFLIRESTSYPDNFVLTMRNQGESSISHFLIEKTNSGLRIHDRRNEPFHDNLSALVLAHVKDRVALPNKLVLGKDDGARRGAPAVENKMVYVFYLEAVHVDHARRYQSIKYSVDCVLGDSLTPVLCKLVRTHDSLVVKDVKDEFAGGHPGRFERMEVPLADVEMMSYDPYSRRLSLKNCFVREKRIFGLLLRSDVCHVFVESQDNNLLTEIFSNLFDC